VLYSSMAGVGTGVWFNLGLAGPAGVWFILVGPVWRWCAGVAGAHFTLILTLCAEVEFQTPPTWWKILNK